ncbi:hypothetical protein CRUP_015572 [Coryphaenoides rupestris]|nr:hypothetical protein CRUP_015572 [Coryphaenoides rupestris]
MRGLYPKVVAASTLLLLALFCTAARAQSGKQATETSPVGALKLVSRRCHILFSQILQQPQPRPQQQPQPRPQQQPQPRPNHLACFVLMEAGGINGEDALDLNHLTEEERSAILEVLMRDMELRQLDEGRVRTLQQTEVNPVRLRSLSGTWFSEERSKRQHVARPGCDLVQSSIRRRRSKGKEVPVTKLFDGKETTPAVLLSSSSPELERRLGEEAKKPTTSPQERITPIPTARMKDQQTQCLLDTEATVTRQQQQQRQSGRRTQK